MIMSHMVGIQGKQRGKQSTLLLENIEASQIFLLLSIYIKIQTIL